MLIDSDVTSSFDLAMCLLQPNLLLVFYIFVTNFGSCRVIKEQNRVVSGEQKLHKVK